MDSTQYELFEKTQQEIFDELIATPYGKEIAEKFIRLAMRFWSSGNHKTYSPWCIMGKIRCDFDLKNKQPDTESYKINNNMIAYFSRHAMRKRPELKGFLPTRELGKKKKRHAVIVPIQERIA